MAYQHKFYAAEDESIDSKYTVELLNKLKIKSCIFSKQHSKSNQ